MLASRLLPSLLLAAGANAAADDDVHPALDLITRNYGAAATASFDLSISAAACPTDAEHGCFVLSQKGAKVSVAAGTMADLTYGIGYYARFSCGLTVGWTRGGGSSSPPLFVDGRGRFSAGSDFTPDNPHWVLPVEEWVREGNHPAVPAQARLSSSI